MSVNKPTYVAVASPFHFPFLPCLLGTHVPTFKMLTGLDTVPSCESPQFLVIAWIYKDSTGK